MRIPWILNTIYIVSVTLFHKQIGKFNLRNFRFAWNRIYKEKLVWKVVWLTPFYMELNKHG
jgi:hypothetical protein